MKNLSENVMWKATVACDPGFDGLFYYAVKTTGIFCRPSCKSKTPNRKNVEFIRERDQALAKGYRPCKRCRPDLESGSHDAEETILVRARTIMEESYDSLTTLADLAGRVGISAFHLHRRFKERLGCTPKEYLQQIRIRKAVELATGGSLPITEICYAVGFRSLSRFYEEFRKRTGYSPRKFKELAKISISGVLVHDKNTER